jgi:hypothetical protein
MALVARCMNLTFGRTAGLRASKCLLEHTAKINLQCIRDAKQGVDGRKAFAFLHPHNHRMAEAGASGHFIEGKRLPEALCLNQFRQPGNDRFTLRSFRHISFLCDEELDSGYDYRHNAYIAGQKEKTMNPQSHPGYQHHPRLDFGCGCAVLGDPRPCRAVASCEGGSIAFLEGGALPESIQSAAQFSATRLALPSQCFRDLRRALRIRRG